jgi:capsular polysaccharide biosynthesis protein
MVSPDNTRNRWSQAVTSTRETTARLARRWWLLALLVALGALAGLGHALLAEPTYTARAHVVVVAQNAGDSQSAVSYAQAYTRIAVQGDALDAAASKGAVSTEELRRHVRASSSPDAPVIEVTGTARSADRAAQLANLMAGGLITAANKHTADTRMKLTSLSAAVPPADPTSPNLALDLAVGAGVGLLLGGLALLAGAGAGPSAAGGAPGTAGPPAGAGQWEPAPGGAPGPALAPAPWLPPADATGATWQRWTARAPVAGPEPSPGGPGTAAGRVPDTRRDGRDLDGEVGRNGSAAAGQPNPE